MAVVTVEMATQAVNVMRKSKRTSFAQTLSTLGNDSSLKTKVFLRT